MNANDCWPAEHASPSTTELSKGLPVDEGRLELVKGLHAAKTALFQDLIREGTVPLRPGILSLVDEALGSGVRLAVCSTSNEAAVRSLVETLMGADRYAKFSFFCGDAVARKNARLFAATLDPVLRVEPLSVDPAWTRLLLGALGACSRTARCTSSPRNATASSSSAAGPAPCVP